MSIAIKTGRYTHTKKAQDIMEVKGLSGPLSTSSQSSFSVQSPHTSANNDRFSEVSPDLTRRPISPPVDTEEIEKIIHVIASTQMKQTKYTPEFVAMQRKNEKIYLVTVSSHMFFNDLT